MTCGCHGADRLQIISAGPGYQACSVSLATKQRHGCTCSIEFVASIWLDFIEAMVVIGMACMALQIEIK